MVGIIVVRVRTGPVRGLRIDPYFGVWVVKTPERAAVFQLQVLQLSASGAAPVPLETEAVAAIRSRRPVSFEKRETAHGASSADQRLP